jgi:hypothetical protein
MPDLTTTLQIGDPVVHRGIAVAPVFPRRDPTASYLTLDDALPRGLRVEETSDAGSVPELVVRNPLDRRVLLYDGEELVGAKQNRILDVTVLVEAGGDLRIPVSCVEQGRWRRTSSRFTAASHAAHPELRRRKAETLAAAPLARGVAQAEVWDAVADKAARMNVQSPTAANADAFRAHAGRLADLERAFPSYPGQSGAVLVLGDAICLDYVSRPDAFVRLWPKLRRGYMLDALERLDQPLDGGQGSPLAGFELRLARTLVTRGRSAGLGDDLRIRGDRIVGSGLELDGELLQLCAFTSDERDGPRGRIARPSLRGM